MWWHSEIAKKNNFCGLGALIGFDLRPKRAIIELSLNPVFEYLPVAG